MKFSCPKSELVQAIQIAGRSIASKPQTPILSGIYIQARNDVVEIQATDYEIGVILRVKADVEEPGELAVSGKYFQDVVRMLPNEEVTVSYNLSTAIVTISAGKSNFTLLSMTASDFPKIHLMEEGKRFNINSAVLKELIRRTTFACSTDESRPLFMGVLMELEGNKARMVATNSHRLAFDEGRIESEIPEKCQYVAPRRVMEEVYHILSGDVPENVEIICTRSEMSFRMEGVYLMTRLIEGVYPDYNRAVPPEFSKRVTLSTGDFLSAVSRVGLIARSSEYNIIKLMFNMGEVHIYSDNPVVGKAEETVPASIEGEDIGIAFNASYLIDVLKILNGETFILEMNDPLKPALVREPDNEDFLYVITPVRTKR